MNDVLLFFNNGGGTKLFAAIGVTYPAGSVVTCTNGTKTLKANNTSGQWVFAIPEPKSLPETWTVTAGNKSKTVTITKEGQFETVVISFALTLFDGGDNSAVTGGWDHESLYVTNPVSVGNTLAISFNASSGDITFGTFVHTKKKINLAEISMLEATITQYNNKSGGAWYMAISDTDTVDAMQWATGNIGLSKVSITKTGTAWLDVSNYNGSYYVGFFTGLAGQSGLTPRLTATKIVGT